MLYFIARFVTGAYLKYRAKRVITCPENSQSAAVELDAEATALISTVTGKLELRLSECRTAGRKKKTAGRSVLSQIQASQRTVWSAIFPKMV